MQSWILQAPSLILLWTIGFSAPSGVLAAQASAEPIAAEEEPQNLPEGEQPSDVPEQPSETELPQAGETPVESEQAEQADQLSQEAIIKFQAKDYQGAVDLFNQAYSTDPNPNYLFNIGRVYEESGDIENAAEYYQQFVQAPGVELEARAFAVKRLEVLQQILKTKNQKTGSVDSPSGLAGESSSSVDQAKKSKSPAQKLRIAGYSLLGIGAGALIAGGTFAALSQNKERELTSTDTNTSEKRDSIINQGKTYTTVANGMFIGGGIVAAVGLSVIFASLAKKTKTKNVAWHPYWGGRNNVGVHVQF